MRRHHRKSRTCFVFAPDSAGVFLCDGPVYRHAMLAQHLYWFSLAVLVALVPTPATATNAVTGKPRIIDGDTIEISSERIRLHGIDAPESKQKCTAGGKEWACGQEATFALAQFIETHWVTCKGDKRDRYGRIIAVCFVGSHDLNAMMVREGWALAYRRYSMDYVDEENEARSNHIGIWRGEFMPPWAWRRK